MLQLLQAPALCTYILDTGLLYPTHVLLTMQTVAASKQLLTAQS